jgi:hypothetical protein
MGQEVNEGRYQVSTVSYPLSYPLSYPKHQSTLSQKLQGLIGFRVVLKQGSEPGAGFSVDRRHAEQLIPGCGSLRVRAAGEGQI